jgi:hypothetical protein
LNFAVESRLPSLEAIFAAFAETAAEAQTQHRPQTAIALIAIIVPAVAFNVPAIRTSQHTYSHPSKFYLYADSLQIIPLRCFFITP